MYRYNKTSIILKVTIAILFITSLVIECSCERSDEPKKESTGFITYTLRWDSVIPGFPAPEKLRYCIYPSEGGPMVQTDGDAKSMMLFLPPATYKILVFNYDAKNIDFRNMSRFDEAEAYILQTKATGQASQGITPLYGFVVDSLEITPGQDKSGTLVLTPLVRHVTFTVQVDKPEEIKTCKGSLSGVSTSLNLSKRKVVTEASTNVEFDMETSDKGVNGDLIILGTALPKEEEQKPVTNQVTIDFTLSDGSTVSATADLEDKLNEIDTPYVNVTINATVEKSPKFTIRLTNWEVGPGEETTIE